MASPLPGPLGKVLADLVVQCRTLCEDNQKLLAVNTALKAQLPNKAKKAFVASSLPNSVNAESDEVVDPVAEVDHMWGLGITADNRSWKEDGRSSLVTEAPIGKIKSWKDTTDLHPISRQFDYGAKTLASARLGMLKPKTLDEPKYSSTGSAAPALQSLMDFVLASEQIKHPRCISVVANSIYFKLASVVAIIANSIYIGIRANRQVTDSYQQLNSMQDEMGWLVTDIVFIVWFAVELVVRGLDEQVLFLTGENYGWNAFDVVLLLSSILDIFIAGNSNLAFLRIFRVFRLLRIARVVRAVKFLRSLRTLIFSVLHSFPSLMWALLMIGIVVYIFAIIFVGAATGYFRDADRADSNYVTDSKDMNDHFGSIFKCMVSLFCAISGGNDWYLYAQTLQQIGGGGAWFLLFVFYVAVCTIGILNVVTGIFVDSAVCTRTEDEVVEHWREDQQRTSEEVRKIFMAADLDMSGTMTLEELMAQLEDPWVKAYFSGLDVDPNEARIIFTLMDMDQDGVIGIDEFVDGIMKLKGNAKSVDVMAMMFDQATFAVKFNHLCSYVEDQMREMKDTMAPGSTPTPRIFPTLEDSLAQHKELSAATAHSARDAAAAGKESRHHDANGRHRSVVDLGAPKGDMPKPPEAASYEDSHPWQEVLPIS